MQKMLLISELYGGENISVVEYIQDKDRLASLIKLALEDYHQCSIDLVDIVLPDAEFDGSIFYEDENETGDIEARLEWIGVYTWFSDANKIK